MRHLTFIPFALALTACSVPDSPTRTSAAGATEIRLQDGKTCYQNQCLTYDPSRGTISVIAHHTTRLPAAIDVSDGYVTATEFATMFERANRTYSNGGAR